MNNYNEFTTSFWKKWEIEKEKGVLRLGQFYFNYLEENRPEIANKLRGMQYVDPFYDDNNMGLAIGFVYDNWSKE